MCVSLQVWTEYSRLIGQSVSEPWAAAVGFFCIQRRLDARPSSTGLRCGILQFVLMQACRQRCLISSSHFVGVCFGLGPCTCIILESSSITSPTVGLQLILSPRSVRPVVPARNISHYLLSPAWLVAVHWEITVYCKVFGVVLEVVNQICFFFSLKEIKLGCYFHKEKKWPNVSFFHLCFIKYSIFCFYCVIYCGYVCRVVVLSVLDAFWLFSLNLFRRLVV